MRQETMGFGDGSGISWTMCEQSAPRSRQITTPTPHHSIFTGRMLFLLPNQQCQSSESYRSTSDARQQTSSPPADSSLHIPPTCRREFSGISENAGKFLSPSRPGQTTALHTHAAHRKPVAKLTGKADTFLASYYTKYHGTNKSNFF